jgi:hypothetical protein
LAAQKAPSTENSIILKASRHYNVSFEVLIC